MYALRIKNLRSLDDTDLVPIKPITLLVGRNSSGKSTFLRTFPLLRQSVEARTKGPLLWYGSYVDFGSFETAVRADADPSAVTLGFTFPLRRGGQEYFSHRYYTPYGGELRLLEDLDANLEIEMKAGPEHVGTYTSAATLSFADQAISVGYDPGGNVIKFRVNRLDVLATSGPFISFTVRRFVPIPVSSAGPARESAPMYRFHPRIAESFVQELRPLFHGNTSPQTIRDLLPGRGIGSSEAMLRDIKSVKRPGGKHWQTNVGMWSVDTKRFERVRDLIVASVAPGLLEAADAYINSFAQSVAYIAPVRATAERYYRMQDLAVDEVDFQGKNLPMFLRSLSEPERRSFEEWVQKRFGVTITTEAGGGHLSLGIREDETGHRYNLADVGFGLSQMLPVVAQIWASTRRRRRLPRPSGRTPTVIAIEQPELHLHPSLQANVADFFVDALLAAREARIDVRMIVETHSEAIVNRIGNVIYGGRIAHDDVSVIVFDKEPSEPTRLRLSCYDSTGFLTNWPYGFFAADESR